jgi:hypothetical protein
VIPFGAILANPFLRGAVTGVGVVMGSAGIGDLAQLLTGAPAEPPADHPTLGRP